MININKIYISNLSYVITERKYYKFPIEKCKKYNSFDNTLEDTVVWMKDKLESEFYDNYGLEPKSDEELYEFVNKYITDFEFNVCVVSGNRKIFNTSKELMNYFNLNIKNISNENLYDFLLSLVQWDGLSLDYKGNITGNCICEQYPINEHIIISDVKFSEKSCKKRNYTFSYKDEENKLKTP